MKLIIDIPEEAYEQIVEAGDLDYLEVITAIENGIPLDDVKAEIDKLYDRIRPYNIDVSDGLNMALDILDNIGKSEKGGE